MVDLHYTFPISPLSFSSVASSNQVSIINTDQNWNVSVVDDGEENVAEVEI